MCANSNAFPDSRSSIGKPTDPGRDNAALCPPWFKQSFPGAGSEERGAWSEENAGRGIQATMRHLPHSSFILHPSTFPPVLRSPRAKDGFPLKGADPAPFISVYPRLIARAITPTQSAASGVKIRNDEPQNAQNARISSCALLCLFVAPLFFRPQEGTKRHERLLHDS